MGVRVVLTRAENLGVIKCRMDDSIDPMGTTKAVRFRVEVHGTTPSQLVAGYRTALHLIQEKGSLSTFKVVYNRLRREWDLDAPSILHGKTAMVKLFASEMAGRVADRAVQIFGGRGYMTENPAERYYRELRVDRIWEGTSEIQRSIIARGLLKRGRDAYTMVG